MKKLIFIFLFTLIPTLALSSNNQINVSPTQQLVLSYLDSFQIKYDYIPSKNPQNIKLANIDVGDNNSVYTIDSLEIVNLNKKYFDNFSINSFDKYKGNLFDKIILKNINANATKVEYFEIKDVDIKQINQLFSINLSNLSEFINSISIDKIYLKNAYAYTIGEGELSFSLLLENINKLNIGSLILSQFSYIDQVSDSRAFMESFLLKNLNFDKRLIDETINMILINSYSDLSEYSTKLDLLRIENFKLILEEDDIEFKFAKMDGTTNNNDSTKIVFRDIYLDRKNNKNPIYKEVIKKLNSDNLYDLVWDIEYNKSKKTSFNKLKLQSNNLFEIILEISLSNYDMNSFAQAQYLNDQNYFDSNVKLNNFILYYYDDGFAKALIKEIEKQESISITKEGIESEMEEFLNEFGTSVFIEKYINEIYKFILKPRNIKISINPNPDLTFTQIMKLIDNNNSAEFIFDKLNMDIKTNM